MTTTETRTLFIAILSAHKGLSRAISVADMAGRLQVSTRRAQCIKAEVVELGNLVGSSCGVSHGWYMPESDAEIQATLNQYKARIRSLARLVRLTEGAAGFDQFVGELQLEFDQEAL